MTEKMTKTTIALAGLATLCLCGSSCVPTRYSEFYIDAVSTHEESVPCAIFIADELVSMETGDPVLTPAKVKVPFHVGADGRFSNVKLSVRSVSLDDDGAVVKGIESDEDTAFKEDFRSVRWNDAKKQLFVVRRNKNYFE